MSELPLILFVVSVGKSIVIKTANLSKMRKVAKLVGNLLLTQKALKLLGFLNKNKKGARLPVLFGFKEIQS